MKDHVRDMGAFFEAKKQGFSDKAIAKLWGMEERDIYMLRKEAHIFPGYRMIDSCAVEFDSYIPYFYSTYETGNESVVSDRKKIIVLGSGPIRIGQGVEFDYSTVHANHAHSPGYRSCTAGCFGGDHAGNLHNPRLEGTAFHPKETRSEAVLPARLLTDTRQRSDNTDLRQIQQVLYRKKEIPGGYLFFISNLKRTFRSSFRLCVHACSLTRSRFRPGYNYRAVSMGIGFHFEELYGDLYILSGSNPIHFSLPHTSACRDCCCLA